MNNENTASQPKVASIGDDAQFVEVLREWYCSGTRDGIGPFDKLVAFIDSFILGRKSKETP